MVAWGMPNARQAEAGALSAEEALDAYAASGARRLLLTHRPSELDPPPGVDLAYDGMELDV